MNFSAWSSETVGACNPQTEEELLIDRVKRNDQNACTEFVNRFGPKMLQVATDILRCEQDAADAVQDAFVSAFRAIGKFSRESRLSTWLHRITVNAALMRLRARRRERQKNLGSYSIDDLRDSQLPACPRAIPVVDRLADQESISTMKASIATLPQTYRDVLELRDLQSIDINDTAQRIGCSRSNVKTRLHRARRALRERLVAC
jgi:RNA polymerase sigma-70 factor (ECF subfamily)